MAFIPLLMLSVGFAVTGALLAKDKGRNVPLWTILACIPVVNLWCLPYLVGASNKRLEEKIDSLMSATGAGRNQVP